MSINDSIHGAIIIEGCALHLPTLGILNLGALDKFQRVY